MLTSVILAEINFPKCLVAISSMRDVSLAKVGSLIFVLQFISQYFICDQAVEPLRLDLPCSKAD